MLTPMNLALTSKTPELSVELISNRTFLNLRQKHHHRRHDCQPSLRTHHIISPVDWCLHLPDQLKDKQQFRVAVLIDWLIEQCLTSPPTQYRLSGREFYRSKDPTNSAKVGLLNEKRYQPTVTKYWRKMLQRETQKKQTTHNTARQ